MYVYVYIYIYMDIYIYIYIHTWIYIYIYIYIHMMGAKYSVTRCSFGLLAASLAGTLREPCGNLAEREQHIDMNAIQKCSTGFFRHPSYIYVSLSLYIYIYIHIYTYIYAYTRQYEICFHDRDNIYTTVRQHDSYLYVYAYGRFP